MDYQSENCKVSYLSDAEPEEAESLIGKTILKIDADHYDFKIIFTDMSTLTLNGHRWGTSSLGVELEYDHP